jgi:outer membrane protein TolC
MYCQFLAAKEMVQLLKEAETRANVVSKMVKIAYETAVPEKEGKGTTRVDYLKARNFLSEIKVKLGEMEKNLKLAELGLKMAMGLDPSASLILAEIPLEGLQRVEWNLKELKETSLSKNIDLRSADLGVQFYESKRKAASKEYLPKIGIFGQYIGPEDRFGNNDVWYVGVGVTLSLFDGFLTRAKVGQAEAQFQKIRGQRLLLEKALSVQTDHLNMNLTEVKERMALLRAAIQEAQERVSLASEGYAAGITEFDDLLYAQKSELEMKSNYLQGLLLYQVTKSEIELILGIP